MYLRLQAGLLLFFCILPSVSRSHEDYLHARQKQNSLKPDDLLRAKQVNQEINKEYLIRVKPIFSRKCMDCHSSQNKYPWYYKMPFIKQMIDEDIAEAQKHIDMTHDFPFQGHGSPEADFKAIKEVMKSKSMPPMRYRILHPGTGITEEDQKIMEKWIDDALVRIEQLNKP